MCSVFFPLFRNQKLLPEQTGNSQCGRTSLGLLWWHATLDFRCTFHSEQYRYIVRICCTKKSVFLWQQEIAPSNTADTHRLRVMGVALGYSADFIPAVTHWSVPVQSDADSPELVRSFSDQALHKILLSQNSSEIQKLTLSTCLWSTSKQDLQA